MPEPGKYLIHITLVPDQSKMDVRTQGERLDVHMGFTAGAGAPTTTSGYALYVLFVLIGLYALYLSSSTFKDKVDALIGKKKKGEEA